MPPVNATDPATGRTVEIDADEARALGWEIETPTEAAARTTRATIAAEYSGVADKLKAGLSAGLSSATIGGFDALYSATSDGEAVDTLRRQREENPGWTAAGSIAGAVIPALASGGQSALARALSANPAGLVSRAGSALARTAPEASAAARIARGALGAGVEGVAQETGTVISDLALAEDGAAVDRIMGSLGTRYLTTGGVSLLAGGGIGGMEHALGSAKRRIAAGKLADEAAATAPIPDDLAALDGKQLRAAQESELAAIDTARAPDRAQIADDLAAFREQMKIEQPWVAVATGSKEAKLAAGAEMKAALAAAKRAEAEATKAAAGAGPALKLPDYATLAKPVRRTVAARDLVGRVRALPGVGEDAVKMDKARQAIAEGQKDPIAVVLRGDGSLEVTDGRHRLLAAMEADKPIKLRIEQGVADVGADDTALIGETFARTTANAGRVKELAEAAAVARAEADAAVQAFNDVTEAMKGANPRWMREAGNTTLRPDKALDSILNDPKALSGAAGTRAFEVKATAAQTALRVQEAALEKILEHGDELKTIHALDRTNRRATALAAIPGALEQNRALQQRIAGLIAEPSSARLNAIKDAIALGPAKMTMRQKIGGALAFGAVMAGASGVDLPGMNAIAPVLGAAAGSAVAGRLGGTIAKTTAAARARQATIVDRLLTATGTTRKVAPPLASKILAAARFAPEDPPDRKTPPKSKPTLLDDFNARSSELARIIAPGPDGKPTLRPEVRRQVAANFAPIAVTDPRLADKMETRAVARVVFIDSKRPRPVQIGMTRIPPSEMAIRGWARIIAAADDPHGVLDRVVDGTITPEDAIVMRELYPDMLAEFTRDVVTRLPELRAKLPYRSRMTLSLLTGAPVDATMEPRILFQLQSGFAREPNTEGGTQAPRPQPAFGSVTRPEGTPAQMRAG